MAEVKNFSISPGHVDMAPIGAGGGNVSHGVEFRNQDPNTAASRNPNERNPKYGFESRYRSLSAESLKSPEIRVGVTLKPQEVRKLSRELAGSMWVTPPTVDSHWEDNRFVIELGRRKIFLSEVITEKNDQSSFGSYARLMGYDDEPWNSPTQALISDTLDYAISVERGGMSSQKEQEILASVEKLTTTENLESVVKEAGDNYDWLAAVSKGYNFFGIWRTVSFGGAIDRAYSGLRPIDYISSTDLANLLKSPPHVIAENFNRELDAEILRRVNAAEDTTGKGLTSQEIKDLRVKLGGEMMKNFEGRTDNEPLGEKIHNGVATLMFVSMSEDPDALRAWQNSLGGEDKFFEYMGFSSVDEGRKQFGDPLLWIPLTKRRSTDSQDYFDFEERRTDIDTAYKAMIKARAIIDDPKTSDQDKDKCYKEIYALRGKIASLSANGNDSVFSTLALENKYGLRGPLTKLGSVLAVPRSYGEKELLLNGALVEHLGNDKLAAIQARVVFSVYNLDAKFGGSFMMDADELARFHTANVEAWPYTSEFAVLCRYNDYILYKGLGAGLAAPVVGDEHMEYGKDVDVGQGGVALYGPLATDYFSMMVVSRKNENGEQLYWVIKPDGTKAIGTAKEGLVVGDAEETLMDMMKRGVRLSDLPFDKVILNQEKNPEGLPLLDNIREDSQRYFLLSSWFAGGRNGELYPLKDILANTTWKPDTLMDGKFWEAYKLDLKIVLRRPLLKEDIWRTTAAQIDRFYYHGMNVLSEKLKKASTPAQRTAIFKEYREKAREFKKTLDDNGFKNGTDEQKRFDKKREYLSKVKMDENVCLNFKTWQTMRLQYVKDYIVHCWWQRIRRTDFYKTWDGEVIEFGTAPFYKGNVEGVVQTALSEKYARVRNWVLVLDEIKKKAKKHGFYLDTATLPEFAP